MLNHREHHVAALEERIAELEAALARQDTITSSQHRCLMEHAIEAEREACAKIAEHWGDDAGRVLAAHIRARGSE